jgi:aspartate/methionine/tyrosine aminotransferase
MDMLRAANEKIAAGGDVVRMEAGQPAEGAPAKVLEAAHAALRSDRIGYTESLGIPELRTRIAAHYKATYGVDISLDRIIVTTGSSGAFLLAFLAAFDVGDRAVLPSPGYPAYRNILKSLDVEQVTLETTGKTRWMPNLQALDELAQSGPLHGLLLASPANPTGTMASNDLLAELARGCADRGMWFISDEIYHGLHFGEAPATALSFNPDVIVINSFSKYYCMTGWRIGWMIMPERLARPVERLAQNHFISAPALSQIAAVAAFDATEELEARKAVYAANREMLLNDLPQAGLDEIMPVDGAFYLYADIRRHSNDSTRFARAMLDEAGVAVTPGIDFDAERGAHYIRFSFAGSNAEIQDGIKRLKTWLR